jgi:hypothetical protein
MGDAKGDIIKVSIGDSIGDATGDATGDAKYAVSLSSLC